VKNVKPKLCKGFRLRILPRTGFVHSVWQG